MRESAFFWLFIYMTKDIENKLRVNKFFPKIPVRDVFMNDNAYSDGYSDKLDAILKIPYEYVDSGKFESLPKESVEIQRIVPTQKFLSFDNLKMIESSHETGAYLVKKGDFYYVLDGHHRIARDILGGEKYVIAHVYDADKKMFEMNVRKIVREVLSESQINEIDWESDFSDVSKKCLNTNEIVDYLNRVRANAPKSTADREKFNPDKPFIHAKSTAFKDAEGGIDVDYFIKTITTPPITIINTNEKILKSGGVHEYVFKTGVPALRGIVYDIEKDKFYIVNTCPGAGACQFICYALKGQYIQYPTSYDGMTRRLNYLLNYPDKYENQMYNELKQKCEEYQALEGYKSKVIIRWNDSGDFFAKRYVRIAESVMQRLKSEGYNIDSYAYTKVADVAKNSEFDTTFSSGGNKGQSSKIDLSKQKNANVIPSSLFKGLNLMRVADEEMLKNRVSNEFKIDKSELLTFDELMATPKSDVPRWTVIVTPNDGDDAAFRKDVKQILLTQH